MIGNSEQWEWLTISKPITAAAILVLLWVLESLAPMFANRDRRLSHDGSNLALGVINAVIAAALFSGAILAVTEWARQ